MIESEIDRARGITTVVCRGKMSIDEVGEWLRDFYEGEPTQLVLWDFGEADVSAVSPEDLQRMADVHSGLERQRDGGRTAVVASSELTFGMSRMYEILTGIAGLAVEVQVFRTREEARGWLLSGSG